MNNVFSGSVRIGDEAYDYAGVFTRRAGGVAWKAIVRNDDVVCRPSGTIDDGLSDAQVLVVIEQLVEEEILHAVGDSGA